MGQRGKVLVTEDGRFDLSAYRWDDDRFSDILIRDHPINADQALDISRFLRKEIDKMSLFTIPLPVIEKMIEAKLLECGLKGMEPIR